MYRMFTFNSHDIYFLIVNHEQSIMNGYVKTNVGQDAASLGAAVVAVVGAGLWKNFNKIDDIHQVVNITKPVPQHNRRYEKLLPIFKYGGEAIAKIGDMLLHPDFK